MNIVSLLNSSCLSPSSARLHNFLFYDETMPFSLLINLELKVVPYIYIFTNHWTLTYN